VVLGTKTEAGRAADFEELKILRGGEEKFKTTCKTATPCAL
jgi:hypothetical protein